MTMNQCARNRLIVCVLSASGVGVLGGCEGGPVETDDDLTAVSQPLTNVLTEDFESQPLGPLGAPWTITSGGVSTVTVEDFGDHGHVARLDGDQTADFLIATRGFSAKATTITSSVQIRPDGGSSFIWILEGAGRSLGRRRIRLQRAPGSDTLVANTVPGGNRACGTLPSGVWSTVSLTVHAEGLPHTFDVRINGAGTACTASVTGLSPPFSGVSIMDASNEGWGGRVRFDSITVTTP
jgi:hypothetical protein